MQPVPDPRVRPAPAPLADHGGPAELLEVVRQLLAAGERLRAGQHKHRLVRRVAGHGQPGGAPVLVGGPGPLVHGVQVGRLGEEPAADQGHHVGAAAPVAAQVEQERVGAGEQPQRGRHEVAGQVRREEVRRDLQQPDVAGQPLHPGHAAHGERGELGEVLLGRVVGGVGQRRLVVLEPQVQVAVARLEVGGDQRAERRRVGYLRVRPRAEPVAEVRGDPAGLLGKDVLLGDQFPGPFDDVGDLVLAHVPPPSSLWLPVVEQPG
ncbi:hypothetical protein B0E53_01625 [Micromonospora sp. MH33]|nr:hypothetical protein B0E53_01625 [Micromonospora sp. MH33]